MCPFSEQTRAKCNHKRISTLKYRLAQPVKNFVVSGYYHFARDTHLSLHFDQRSVLPNHDITLLRG